jgi:hypothetical protein
MQGYAPLCLGLEDFFVRRLYLRVQVWISDASVGAFGHQNLCFMTHLALKMM